MLSAPMAATSAESPILIVKTGALGDVLRTTSILPGLHERYPGCRVTWVTAPGAVDLVRPNRRAHEVLAVDPRDSVQVDALATRLVARSPFVRVLSFDDEEPLCRLAARVGGGLAGVESGVLSGAWLDGERRTYSPDVGPWFDMGLLSVHGKDAADRLKAANTRSHPAIFADMLGVRMGEPELELPSGALAFGAAFARSHALGADGCATVGLNTGAGGRWESKRLPVERVEAVVRELDRRLSRRAKYVLLGGRDEAERNAAILARLTEVADSGRLVDAGTANPLLEFAALVDRLDLLLTSDSLAMHVAIARRVPVVAFFAPTSADEIELYGRGESVRSTAPDYCSYRAEADTSTLTVERLCDAVVRQLGGARSRGSRAKDPA
jgi:heptosyltransferase-2